MLSEERLPARISIRPSTEFLNLICVLTLLTGAMAARGTTGSFGPYVIKQTLPVSFNNVAGLTYANGSLYALDRQGYIHQMNPQTGQVVADWLVPGLLIPSGDENPTGLAWDGNHFWMASYGTQNRNYLRDLTLGGPPNVTINATYTLPNMPNVSWPMDLTYANGLLIYPEYLGPFREFNPGTGQVVASVPSPGNVIYGLTFDGQSWLAADGFSSTLWRISPQAGAILDTWQTGAPNTYALAYDIPSQTLFIGTLNEGIIVAQVPEPGSITIGLLGIIGSWLAKAHRRS